MAHKSQKSRVLDYCKRQTIPLSLAEIREGAGLDIPDRTLRRWLAQWVEQKLILRVGTHKATRYLTARQEQPSPRFLDTLPAARRDSVLKQLRDLWTHSSTAIEGNTLTLGDTHFILEEGLTISGKPLKDHQEVVGHANAINILYTALNTPLDQQLLFDLHKAIQSEKVFDIDKPNGDWKVEINGTYSVTSENQSVYIEYAPPQAVPMLMAELIKTVNSLSLVRGDQAAYVYAKIHAGIAHIHPFWDGNGRIARLVANLPLLKSGLPPLVISLEQRRRYIQILADYEVKVGQLTKGSGVWPNKALLNEFVDFCKTEYEKTQALIQDN